MRLIGTELGRMVVLLTQEEWRPTKLSTFDAMGAIKDRYSFAYAPSASIPWETLQKDGFKFSQGKFRIRDLDASIQDLTFFSDGIVVNAHNTDEAEAFFQDLISWAKEFAGVRDLTNVGRKLYVSHVIVEFERPVNQLINRFQEFSLVLNQLMRTTYEFDFQMQLRTLGFHYDHFITPEWHKPTYFSIDRRIGHKYEANRFFCESPLRTNDHLLALRLLEEMLPK